MVRDHRLLDQARHWNLTRLVQALEALTPGVSVTRHPGGKSCTVQCRFVSVFGQLSKKKTLEYTFCLSEQRLWLVFLREDGVFLEVNPLPGEDDHHDDYEFPTGNSTVRILLKEKVLEHVVRNQKWIEAVPGIQFAEHGIGYEELASEPLARAHGCIVVEFEVK